MIIRAVVAGGRDFKDYEYLKSSLLQYLNPEEDTITIVSGCATGADKLGEQFAEEYGCDIARFPADWDNKGKYAGYLRNTDMAKYAIEDPNIKGMLFAFWNEQSRGTANMIQTAERLGIENHIFIYKSAHKYRVGETVFCDISPEYGYEFRITKCHTDGTYDLYTNSAEFYHVPESHISQAWMDTSAC